MKKSLIVLTAALSFGFAAAQTAPATQVPTLTDVPAGHWAKDAIDKIVAKGIILGYPDGTFRGTQNLTRYEAAVIIARLLDQIATGTVTNVSGATVQVTAEDLAALQNAVQELAADLAALGVRVTDLEANSVSQDDFARLEARVEALGTATAPAGDPAALDALTAQIADVNARVDDLQANYDGLRADVDDNASSIAALNDLTVLLNNDILGLQDRVSAVETTIPDLATRADLAALGTKVTGIDTRVTTLENAPKVSFTGQLDVAIGNFSVTGRTNFDIDRTSFGTFLPQVNDVAGIDTNATLSGYNFTFGLKASNLTTAVGPLVVNDATVNFGVVYPMYTALSGAAVNLPNLLFFKDATINGKLAGSPFKVVYDYRNSVFRFNDYLFRNDLDPNILNVRNGAVATFTATSLPFSPKLTVVAGVGSGPVLKGNYFGVRAEINPAGLGTLGLNFAQNVGNRTAAGIDANFRIGAFNLVGVYDVSAPDNVPGGFFNVGNKAGYVQTTANLGVARIAANFRAIDPAYTLGVAGMSATDVNNGGNAPYAANQTGYGAALSTTLGPVTAAAFGDRRTDYVGSPGSVQTAFGVAAGATVFGLKLTAFYNNATRTINNTPAHINGDFAYNGTGAYQGVAFVPFSYSSTYGAILTHDGAAPTALVKGLNFTVADAYFYGDAINDFQVYGNYTATVAGLTLTPFARYHAFSVPGNNGTTPILRADGSQKFTTTTLDGAEARSYTAVKYGIKVTSAPFNIIGKPNVALSFSNSITTPGNTLAQSNASKTELFGQAVLNLNDVGLGGLVPSVGYGYYQGYNIPNATVGAGADAFNTQADRLYSDPLASTSDPYSGGNFGTAAGSTQGVFAGLNYLGVGLNYGTFYYTDFNNAANNTSAQAFRINYSFRF